MLAPVGSASCGRAQVLGGGRVSSVVIDAQVFDKHKHVMERALSPTGLFRPAGFGKCAADYVWNVFCEALEQRKPSSSCKSGVQSSSMSGDDERFLLQGTGMASARLEPKKVDVGLGIRSEVGNFGPGGGRQTPLGPRVWAQQQQRKVAKLKKLRMDLEPPSTPSIVVEGEKIAMETRLWASAESQLEAESVNVSNQSSLPGIIFPPLSTVGKSTNIVWHECMVKREEREAMLGQRGCVIWMTGLSGSGKSTLACTLDHALLQRGKLCYVLDGDNMRHGLNKNLGFSAEDRSENIRRVGEVAKLFADAGIICIASFISPYKKDREACRELVSPGDFIEVFMNFPLTVCEQRDPKGLYKLARAGKIKCFTGIDDPYEEPVHSEIVMEPIDGVCPTPEVMAAKIISYLEGRGILQSRSV